MRNRVGALVVAAGLALAAVVSASAQVTTGTVTGTIKDTKGGVIPGATVVLISEARNIRSAPAVTNGTGDFVFPNVAPDVYTVEVTMDGFKTLKRAGLTVGSGNRVGLGALTIEVGGLDQTVEVRAEAPVIQAQSGERSFTITTDSVQNLPIANRSFTALTSLTPGVSGNARIGGGGGNNIMVDGVSAVDTGSNAILLQINVESIAEVKVLTSGYQAEYGRSSGLQVTAVTKSGSNRLHGSLYDVERNSDWNANSKVNQILGNAKPVLKERDWGYSLGGPVGRPGGNNRVFFFYSQEYAPRKQGGSITRFRVPTALERAGDFSKTYDNNGALYNLIKDASTGLACTATNTTGCFQDGGVVGKIPAANIYPLGQTILNLYPMPTIADAAGLGYNYEVAAPIETALGWQPAVRVDFQPSSSIRVTAKYSGWAQSNKEFLGTLSALTASKQWKPVVFTDAFTVNYTLNSTTFLEGVYGHSQNDLAGCALAQGGTGPSFCTGGIPTGSLSNKVTAGLGALPSLFPSATAVNPAYYAFTVLSDVAPPMFQNGQVLKTPNFSWGSRVANAPPNVPFAAFLNHNATDDVSVSVTRVEGRHTFKGGFYNTHSLKIQNGSNNGGAFPTYNFAQSTNNPLDSTFGYANAILGITTGVTQRSVAYSEGQFIYNNTEGFIQDNWKVNSRLTLDYGVRLVHQQPQYDRLGQASNFFPQDWKLAQAPTLYLAGCPGGGTCSSTARQAMNPLTGQLLGAGTSAAIGTVVPASGNSTNGLHQSGQGIVKTTYTWPTLRYAPRFGAAYDLSGNQRLVLRGGAGLYFDRPSGNSIFSQVVNPPVVKEVTVNNADLRTLAGGLEAPPALAVFEYAGGLPSSAQWNAGAQMALPWASSFDIAYVGQHAWNQYQGVNINAIDFGSAFLAQNQDPSQAATFFGSNTVPDNQMRAFRGFGAITQQNSRGWNTFHSLQLSFQRRFSKGISLGFNDTWSLKNQASTNARLQHSADGSYTFRADQAQADALLQTDPVRHNLKANFVWQLPSLKADDTMLRVVGAVVNGWQLSGIWTASTGAPYTVGFNYQNGGGSANLTGSSDYAARIRIVGDTGKGCGSDLSRQFNAVGFAGPLVNSVGLESGNSYLKGCFQQVFDLAIARNVPLGHGRNIQLRAEMFNAPNQFIVTGRNTTINLSGPTDPTTITNLPYDASGSLIATKILPNSNAGVGVVNAYQAARSVQVQVRFSF